MARFHGRIGFAEATEESPPGSGVYVENMVERYYFGDILQNNRQIKEGEQLNATLATGNEISIVADAYASEHFFAMRYVEWAGALWSAQDVVVQSPRLILRLGGVYNGPVATP